MTRNPPYPTPGVGGKTYNDLCLKLSHYLPHFGGLMLIPEFPPPATAPPSLPPKVPHKDWSGYPIRPHLLKENSKLPYL